MKYSVGQKLWFVPHPFFGRKKSHEITIKKIGKKYLECDEFYHSKILISNLSEVNPRDNSYYYSGQAYLSKEQYEKEVQIKDAANILCLDVEANKNKLTMEQIEKIWDILKEVDNG